MPVITTQHKFEITKLPLDIKKKWVDALRSGKYIQGSGSLFEIFRAHNEPTKKTYCCLGVLGSVCGVEEDFLENNEFFTDLHIDRHLIPKDVWEFSANEQLQQMLADNNDGNIVKETGSEEIGKARVAYKRATFEELADWIEENL